MSTFLRYRHYRIVIAGIHYLILYDELNGNSNLTLNDLIIKYMNETGISYTQQDVTIIQTAYLQKYGRTPG